MPVPPTTTACPGRSSAASASGRVDVDQQAVRQREHRGVHAAERELARSDASLELGKERPRVRAGKRDPRSGNRSGGSQGAERAGRHERGVDGQGDDDLVPGPRAGRQRARARERATRRRRRARGTAARPRACRRRAPRRRPRRAAARRARRASRRETARAPSATRSAQAAHRRRASDAGHARVRQRLRVHGRGAAADEPAERRPAVGCELHRERRRRADRDEHRAPGDGRLLHELEREPPADAEDRPRERQEALAVGPAEDLVHRVVPADVLPHAASSPSTSNSPVAWSPPVSAKVACAARAGRGAPRRAEAARRGRSRSAAHRPPPPRARPSRRRRRRTRCRRTAGPLESDPGASTSTTFAARSPDGRAAAADPLGEAEAERKLLVVAGRPHRHRDGRAVDADLERLLDGEAIHVDRAVRQPPHRHA